MIFGLLFEGLWGGKGRPNYHRSALPGSTGRGRGGVKTPPQREEGFWEEGCWGRDAPKPPVAQRACGITVGITIALVIERKKLSPEARKQTRASDSLKITSKNNFTFPITCANYSPGDRAQKIIPGGTKTNGPSESLKIKSKKQFYGSVGPVSVCTPV